MGCPAAARVEDAPTDPKGMTVEQLIGSLTDVKAKKAELERREKDLVEAVKAKLKDQKDRLHQLGVPIDEAEAPIACPVGSSVPCGPGVGATR